MDSNSDYKQEWVNEVRVNEWSVMTYAKQFENPPSKAFRKLESLLLLKALTFVDLATLFGDDTTSNVSAVINKACKSNFIHLQPQGLRVTLFQSIHLGFGFLV